jgi:hypothetical protein
MSDQASATIEHQRLRERLEVVRAKLRETGATVLSPTAEWLELRKELLVINRKLK